MDANRGDGGPLLPGLANRREPSVHQLRLFLVLAQELHFGRAAARMFMTQPAFSQQIRALEDRIGVKLVDRTSRVVDLTVAGRDLLPEVRGAVDAMSRLRKLADIHVRGVSGRLVVGSIGAEASLPHARAVLAQLRKHHPQLEVEVRTLDFIEHFVSLRAGAVDAAFMRGPLPAGFQSFWLASEPRVVCLSTDDPLAGEEILTLAQLAHHTVVDMPAEVPRLWWDRNTVNPRPDGTRVRFGPVVRDPEAMVLTALQGRAIAFMPSAARYVYPRPGLAYVNVPELAASVSMLAWLPENRDQPVVRALREAARLVMRRREHNAEDREHGQKGRR